MIDVDGRWTDLAEALSFQALMSDSSEWKTVRRGRGGGRKGKLSQSEKRQADETVDREKDKRRLTEAVNELRYENFWREWKDIMSCCLAETVDCRMECVCYGLGNFSSCMSARYQLAMLILLLDALQIAIGQCSLYDPVFTVSECESLRELGFTVLTENEEGKRAVCCPTLFYLMHCGKALYNNLLWKNWNPLILPKVLVIGNSFLGIRERMLQRELERNYGFLFNIIDACEETKLPCPQRFLDVFNDTAVISFPPHKLHKLPESIWDQPSEPHYELCHVLEIIQKDRELK